MLKLRVYAALLTCAFLLLPASGTLAAQPSVTGRTLRFDPGVGGPGQTINLHLSFVVRGGSFNLAIVVKMTTTPATPAPPPPAILLGELGPGEYERQVGSYTVPSRVPESVCFDIEPLIRNACLVRRGTILIRDPARPGEPGTMLRPPSPVPSTEKPDLRIISPSSMVRSAGRVELAVENVGRTSAQHVLVNRECFTADRWIPGYEFERILMLNPGPAITVRREFPPCPSGTTKVRYTVDPRSEIAEMDEGNNSIEVSALANLKIDWFTIWGFDKSLTEVKSRFCFDVLNIGPADAGQFAFEISKYQDGRWSSFVGQRIPGIRGGDKAHRCLDLRRVVSSGERFRLRVDWANQVPESDEGDNTMESIPQP